MVLFNANGPATLERPGPWHDLLGGRCKMQPKETRFSSHSPCVVGGESDA